MADSDDEWGNWAKCERARASQLLVFGASTLCSAGQPPSASAPAVCAAARSEATAAAAALAVCAAAEPDARESATASAAVEGPVPEGVRRVRHGPQNCHVTKVRQKKQKERA